MAPSRSGCPLQGSHCPGNLLVLLTLFSKIIFIYDLCFFQRGSRSRHCQLPLLDPYFNHGRSLLSRWGLLLVQRLGSWRTGPVLVLYGHASPCQVGYLSMLLGGSADLEEGAAISLGWGTGV